MAEEPDYEAALKVLKGCCRNDEFADGQIDSIDGMPLI